MEITSRYDGVVKKVHYKLGEMAKVGMTLIDIEVDDATAAAFQASAPSAKSAMSPMRRAAPTPVAAAPKRVAPAPIAVEVVAVAPAAAAPLRDAALRQQRASGEERVLTSPSVRRLAKEHDIDLLDVIGTGPGGRLLKEDLLEHIRMLASQPKIELVQISSSAAPAGAAAGSTAGATYLEHDTVVALSRK